MVLKFQDYTKQRLEEDVRLFQNYYKFRQSNTYGLNDELDAFRMAYISSYIAYKYGDKVAKKQFESNLKMDSEYNNETLKEASMKIWNARVGREIAKDLKKSIKGKNLNDNQIKSMLAYSISEKLYDGKMVTSLNENKNYDDFDEVYFEKQEVEKIKPSANKPLEGKIEQNIPKDENKETDNSNTNNQYEYIETPCVGSYEVSGYTKKDGTEVEDYIRTCGAKHIRKVKKKGGDDNDYMDKNIIPTNQNIISVDNNLDYKQIKNPDGSYKFEMRTSEQLKPLRYSEIYNKPVKLKFNEKMQGAIVKRLNTSAPTWHYYQISLDLASGKIDKIKKDKYNIITKFSNFEDGNLKTFIRNKIIKSRNLYPTQNDFEEKINNSYVITAKENSPLTKQIINSDKFKEFIKENKDDIVSGKLKNKVISLIFELPKGSRDNTYYDEVTLFGVLHKTDIYNIHVDNAGNIIMDIVDDYNFDYWEKSNDFLYNTFVDINNRAYHQQLAGELQPFILHIPIKIKNQLINSKI